MFFKRKISVSEYCTTRFDLLFSAEQAERWLEIKRSNPDPAVAEIDDDLYLAHLRAAHIELLSTVITKRYPWKSDILMALSLFTGGYLRDNGHSAVEGLLEAFSRTLGSSPMDRSLATAVFVMDSLCQDRCTPESLSALQGQFHWAVEAFRADFKEIKLVP